MGPGKKARGKAPDSATIAHKATTGTNGMIERIAVHLAVVLT
jgi:hypothetical protein